MSAPICWRHKDEWQQRGADFLVVVSRHAEREGDPFTGPHRWAVYAYIYPTHARFAAFDGPHMWQDAATALPLHGGPSLLRWHYDDAGKPTSVQVGADYNHLHDGAFTHCGTPDTAYPVFNDAAELFNVLQREYTP